MRLHSLLLASTLAALAATTSVGCVGGNKGVTSEDKDRLKAYILDAPPVDMQHKVDVNFENRLHLIGYSFSPETAKPGTEVKITYWWRCDDTVEEGWQLFTHLHDASQDKSDNMDWNGPIRENRNNKQILGPDRWEKGKIYVDEQTYKMPDWLKGPELTVLVGIWKGDARLRIVSGANDGDNRAIVGKIKTGLVPPPAEEKHTDIPALNVNKLAANDKIVIDGKLDDKAWGAAAGTGPFVDVGSGKPAPADGAVNGSAKLAWDDANLYVAFDVKDEDILGFFTDKSQENFWTTTGQPKLWTKDTVEIMIDPDGDGDNKDYYELQINPQNKQFHTQYDGYNTPKTEPNGPFGHEDWDPKMKTAVVVKGTMDKAGDKDVGYTVEAAIPWSAFAKAANHPPKPGDTWRMNFYAMKQNGGVAWSAIMGQGNFHKSSRFGKVTWTVPGMGTADAGAKEAGAADAGGTAKDAAAPRLLAPAPAPVPAPAPKQ